MPPGAVLPFDVWSEEEDVSPVNITCLLPTGVVIPLTVPRHANIFTVKQMIWKEKSQYPLSFLLRDEVECYVLVCVNQRAEKEELINESRLLSDVRPFMSMLKVMEKNTENRAEKILNAQISVLIKRGLHELDGMKDPEIVDFRKKTRKLCEDDAKAREEKSWLERALYYFPPDVTSDIQMPQHLIDRLNNRNFEIQIHLYKDEVSYKFLIPPEALPSEVIMRALLKKSRTSNRRGDEDYTEMANKYVLKVVGEDSYLLYDYPLTQYKYMRRMAYKQESPQLVIVPKSSIFEQFQSDYNLMRAHSNLNDNKPPVPARPKRHLSCRSFPQVNLWDLPGYYSLTVHCVKNVNMADYSKLHLRVALYHGYKELADIFDISDGALIDGGANWEKHLTFNIKLIDLPCMARLCFALYAEDDRRNHPQNTKTKRAQIVQGNIKVDIAPLSWVNITVFDYKSILKTGPLTLPMWSSTENSNSDDIINYLGIVGCNCSEEEATTLYLTLDSYDQDKPIVYPQLDRLIAFAEDHMDVASPICDSLGTKFDFDEIPSDASSRPEFYFVPGKTDQDETSVRSDLYKYLPNSKLKDPSSRRERKKSNPAISMEEPLFDKSTLRRPSITYLYERSNSEKENLSMDFVLVERPTVEASELLQALVDKNPLEALQDTEMQEKELIWKMRYECMRRYRHALSKLLNSVDWNNHVEVALMQKLLTEWPQLKPVQAMELLDIGYMDREVRRFAVRCLTEFTDSELYEYLLQLVQVLKYEDYLYSDLMEFLLKRALNNSKIGLRFFWLLRSELHVPSVSVRFGLILEAYCRGSPSNMASLYKQCEALTKLSSINKLIKTGKQSREKSVDILKKSLKNKMYTDALSTFKSPLNPSENCDKLRANECKFFDSKMKPLWMVWDNQDELATDTLKFIYKIGDDLRQDMLTLQIINFIDRLWQDSGLDLRMNPYGCLTTGKDEGLIESVTHAKTIASIQKEYAKVKFKAAFNKEALYNWIQTHNPTEERLEHAIDEFTRSCAGYCVATYVLGIADRHNDNIMIKENGQLFHIDFGHILGNFKSKFGIKRERVPFVLTNDFVYIITKGQTEGRRYEVFKRYCQEAFLILRQNSNLLLTLFILMVNSGLPEVNKLKDVEYISNTLSVDRTEQEAQQIFNEKLAEALKNSWKTSINWTARIIKGM